MAHNQTNADPGPLGLMGFGMTTVLLNLHNAQIVPMGGAILAMGLVFGGATQFVAGLLEYFNNNTFGMTAFMSYGAFWVSLVALQILPHWGLAPASSPSLMGSYLLMWGLFTAIMTIGTLHASRMNQVVFASLMLLFVLLGCGELLEQPTLTVVAGYEGLFCGFCAILLAAKELFVAQSTHNTPVTFTVAAVSAETAV
ncbi:acetate uptake transporter [Komagataeibacter diospyri]|uniref:acetate uptake transporter n=1 Tax=Komagataeibacter diospyri TaxID=1932662 RepID=UPI003756E08D